MIVGASGVTLLLLAWLISMKLEKRRSTRVQPASSMDSVAASEASSYDDSIGSTLDVNKIARGERYKSKSIIYIS